MRRLFNFFCRRFRWLSQCSHRIRQQPARTRSRWCDHQRRRHSPDVCRAGGRRQERKLVRNSATLYSAGSATGHVDCVDQHDDTSAGKHLRRSYELLHQRARRRH